MIKKICLALGLLLLLCSCAPKIDPPLATAPQKPLSEAPAIEYDSTDYPGMMDSLFSTASVAAESDLEVVVDQGNATLVAYKGNQKEVKLPASVGGVPLTAIGDGAFAENKSLEVLVLPDSITDVGEGILKNCDRLRALYTPVLSGGDKQHLGYLFGAEDFRDNARDVPAALEMVRFGPGITELADFALYDCNDLIAVDAVSPIKTIGKFAFYGCKNLKYLPLSDLLSLGEMALGGCRSLVKISLPATLGSIGLGALSECAGLRDLTLPFVGGSASENRFLGYIFGAEVPDHAGGCYPARLQKITVLSGCTSLGDYAFFECKSLRSLSLPEGISSIGVRAFTDCDSLTELELPLSVVSLGENCFSDCDYLASITLGNSLREMGVNAFLNCVSLTEIALPHTLESLPASAFANCVSLKTVDLANVKVLGDQAFRNCAALSSVTSGQTDISYGKGNDRVKDLLKQ